MLKPLFKLCLLLLAATASAQKPNIVWLSAEDISPNLGCYGDPYAITPNLDKMAAEGTRFTSVYTTAGVCAPSRSGIITGMYQNSIGTHHMRCNATLPKWLKTLPAYLREAGYYCSNDAKTDYQFATPSPKDIWNESSRTAHWKKHPENQPFFAVFNFEGTHEGAIENKTVYGKVTKHLTADQRQDPAAFSNIPPYYPDTPEVRENWKRYYELITGLDQWVGDHLQAIKDAGEWENTIVIFWSDHGVGLPRAKRWLYESGTHVPFIMHVPEKFRDLAPFQPGTVEDRLINGVDFAPTMLTLAGLKVPEYMQGRSFITGAPRQYVYGARDRMDERYDAIRAVRDNQFRYIRNFEPLKAYYQYMNTPERGKTMKQIRLAEKSGKMTAAVALFSANQKPTEELYDLDNDPHEINNLANNPAYQKKLIELRNALTEWQLEIGDLGLFPESEIERQKKQAGSDFAILRQSDDPATYIKRLTTAATDASTAPDRRLAVYLTDSDPVIRYWGAIGMGNFAEFTAKSPAAIVLLKQRLTDQSPAVRIASARALCRAGADEFGLPVLSQELAGDNQWARLEAAIVLDELDEIARPTLAALQAALKNQPNKYIIRVANKAVNDLQGTQNKVP
ncbi:sulfatase-like hydrolase/transferase [Coraliomargarita sp. W4R53]